MRVTYQGRVVSDDGEPRGLDRLPQLGDTVEHVVTGTDGTVKQTKLPSELEFHPYEFYVRWSDGYGGWYHSTELVVIGGAPASDPELYR